MTEAVFTRNLPPVKYAHALHDSTMDLEQGRTVTVIAHPWNAVRLSWQVSGSTHGDSMSPDQAIAIGRELIAAGERAKGVA